MPYFFFTIFLLLAAAAYGRHRRKAPGRYDVRLITLYGLAFCVTSFLLWALAQMRDITDSLSDTPAPHLLSALWLRLAVLMIGLALLVISFFTRKGGRHVA